VNGIRARCLIVVVTVVAIVAGCDSRAAISLAPDPASPSPPATSLPTVEPTTATPSLPPTAAPTPVSLARPSGVRFRTRDEGTCPSDPRELCSIDETVVTVSWKAPRTEGVEIRVYGVTRCLGTNAAGAPIDGACLREGTRLPPSALVLLAAVPASDGRTTVRLQPSARGLADTEGGEKVYSVVLGAFGDAGDQSVMAIAATQDYCEATKDPCASRRGVTMTGEAATGNRAGRLLITLAIGGLAPGESVTLQASARYRATWTCGEATCQPGSLCGPAAWDETAGTAKATARAVAVSDGTASARLRLVAPPPAAACPADGVAPWYGGGERWTWIKVSDPAHRLRLTPEPVEARVVY
jgi:hypothetical protein